MSTVAESSAHVTSLAPAVIAGLLLAARPYCLELGLPAPTAGAIIKATGAQRSAAYAHSGRVREALDGLQRPVGRPRSNDEDGRASIDGRDCNDQAALTRAMLEYVMGHPGAVEGGGQRGQYSEGLRRGVLDLRRQYPSVTVVAFARAVNIPVGTIKQWLRLDTKQLWVKGIRPATTAAPSAAEACAPSGGEAEVPAESTPPAASAEPVEQALDAAPAEEHDGSDFEPFVAPRTAEVLQIETLMHSYQSWTGTLAGFVEHANRHLSIPHGRDAIAGILRRVGLLDSRPRAGRSPDELAQRGSFETHYPGAQWVGDGKQVAVMVDGQLIMVNMQLTVDAASAASAAWVGLCVSAVEDSEAVICSYGAAFATVGHGPLAILLDGKPCNHTEEVAEAIAVDEGFVIEATAFRPQNKAHCEGAFGLFAQELPPIVLSNTSAPKVLALEVLRLAATAYARGLNGRPMRSHGGKSRSELYEAKPTEEQVERAKADLFERLRRQQKARQTATARQDPVKRQRLDEAFEQLGLADPKGKLRLAIARYPLPSILDGLAIYRAMAAQDTLPEGVDARYLLGIVRNRARLNEDLAITDELIRERTRVQDALLAMVQEQKRAIDRDTPERDTRALLYVERAVGADRNLEQQRWLLWAAEEIRSCERDERDELLSDASRRIHTSFRLDRRRRRDLSLHLVAESIPIS